jgi:hypothetical protein
MQGRELYPEKSEEMSELESFLAYLKVVVLVSVEVTLIELTSFNTS